MDPLSIQMAMGSPPALRTKISLSNLVGRKKKSPESDKSTTPRQRKGLATISESSLATPTRSDTVRTRRGFRPLSVLTNSVLSPFEFDTLKAMKEIEEDSNDRLLANEAGDPTKWDAANPGAHSPSRSISEMSQALTALPLSNESEISLRAFLQQPPPTDQHTPTIEAPYSVLYDIPAPDITQHPAFSANPFTSQSDLPNLATTSTADEIKKFRSATITSSSHVIDRTSGSSDIFGGSDKKKFSLFEKSSSPVSPDHRDSSVSVEQSPLAKRQPKSCPIEIPYKIPDTPTTEDERKRVSSGGLRKFSDMLKPRRASDKVDTPVESPTTEESPANKKRSLEYYLRTVTCSPTFPYTDNSWYPQHPNTGRMWKSRNLKCTNCVVVSCGCCGKTCCAYKSAVMALETHKRNPANVQVAQERIQQITSLYPYGQELPTFLQCTTGSGCGKLVCPECCGQCPDEICRDIQCRKCKKDPWAECDWHTDLPQLAQLAKAPKKEEAEEEKS